MRSDVRVVLRHWLGADVRAVEGLSEEALDELSDVLTAAREQQARALAAASDEALRQMPPMVRGTVSRLLGW
ncbi:hypothetical protein [Actinophytocola algeriensis]|uniref:Uncharacterized protein n=1 Tax=Actinophytocola algeriensis TaxID=1768010 RepID=A0A7W7Q1S8_9PSEU|nr:hypothetical protein [Actinophytocola algeriensis]MBB4905447.1 hypothetical protein [Actinophytocola algeriensis]MBE1472868.1 hypothetical protein [Actinophytocola algeriensis]